MSNTLNTIHYAVEIDTGSSLDRASIGLYTGKFRYVTDDYNTSGATYEDTSAVTEVFNTDLLLKNGIKQSSQSIDLISGGDYSFLAGMSIDLVNTMNLHKIITSTAGLYLVGASMTFYVIIDDVFYTKWSGVVSEYNFDDSKFTFIGADKNNSNNNTISDVSFGYSYSKLKAVVEDEQAILENQFLKIITPDLSDTSRPVQWFDVSGNGIDVTDEDKVLKYFNGIGAGSKEITPDPKSYRFYLNGDLPEVTDGMFARFEGDDTLYPIGDVQTGGLIADGGTAYYTSFLVSRIPTGLTDYGNLYGLQPSGAPTQIKTATAIASTDTVGVSIFQYGNSFLIPDGSEAVVSDGLFVVVDGDGNTITLNGKTNSDGTVTITDSNYYTLTIPTKITYFSDGTGGTVTTEIEAGTAKNIEQYATEIKTIPNDANIGGDYWETSTDKNHYFILEFDNSIEGKLPAIILSSGIDSVENWTIRESSLLAVRSIFLDDTYTLVDTPTQYFGYGGVVSSVMSQRPLYDVEVYNVITDIDRGEVPFFTSEFSLINTRTARSIRVDSNIIETGWKTYSITVKSIPTTSIAEDFFKSTEVVYPSVNTPSENYLQWDSYDALDEFGSPVEFWYPDGAISPAITSPTEITATSKMMFRISQNSTYDGLDNRTQSIEYITTDGQLPDETQDVTIQPSTGGTFGVNTIGLYEVNVLTTSSDLSFKTVNETNNTYESVLQELSGSTSNLPNRDLWSVGGVIEGEVNTFSLVTTLCKQGYIAGYTNRLGEVVLNEFIENTQTPVVHDNNNTIDNSISKFKLSSISKCYNEFTLKYHYINGKNQKTLGVYKVDQEAFPAIDDVDPVWVSAGSFSDTLEYDSLSIHIYTFKAEKGVQSDIIDNDINNLFRATLSGFNGVVVFTNAQAFAEDATFKFYDVEIVSESKPLVDGSTYSVDYWYYNTNDSFALWKSYVVGIASYPDAKEIWQQARNSYLLNSRIRKAPSERTDLKYAVDLNLYSTETSEDESEAYARSYFKQLISWTTRQKLQVSYKMPITDQTILYNITDRVSFSDPIITPDTFEYADGWITSLGVDPMNDVVNVTLTLDPDYLTPVKAFPECDFIIEDYANTDTITEAYTNIDTITEQYEC